MLAAKLRHTNALVCGSRKQKKKNKQKKKTKNAKNYPHCLAGFKWEEGKDGMTANDLK